MGKMGCSCHHRTQRRWQRLCSPYWETTGCASVLAATLKLLSSDIIPGTPWAPDMWPAMSKCWTIEGECKSWIGQNGVRIGPGEQVGPRARWSGSARCARGTPHRARTLCQVQHQGSTGVCKQEMSWWGLSTGSPIASGHWSGRNACPRRTRPCTLAPNQRPHRTGFAESLASARPADARQKLTEEGQQAECWPS
jgi:hypothetical protein